MTSRFATVSILSAFLLSTFACASSPAADPGLTASWKGDRVVVAPLNLGIKRAEKLEAKSGAVSSELVMFLQDQGAEVSALSHEDGLEIWGEAFTSVGSKTDYRAAVSQFARLVAAEGEFDLLVLPSVVMRGARVQGRAATWDGVRRDVEMSSPVVDTMQEHGHEGVKMNGLKGNMAAASLHVVAVRPTGEIVFEGIAGLDLMQKAEMEVQGGKGAWTLEDRDEPLRDLDHLREGIEMAFERRLQKTARSW